ncbi:MAG: methyltransferase regulatory domain-containing protein [Desulfacinum sp.]|nr:methyltransferase regulatory domain-containing protein [Desulfacinum sp.]
MTWNHGYNVDLGYTYGYYREQDPAWLDLCALIKRVAPPSLFFEGKLRYLELGCGQGVNLCLIAACHPHMEFVGIDFNPQHIAHAQGLAKAAGLANVRFVEGNFVALAEDWPSELGRFHYLTAHGIYTWIAPEVCAALVRCLDAAAHPGALVYLSYNTMPGWLSTVPVQHLLRFWQKQEGLPSLKAIDVGHKRLQALMEANAAMTRVLPALKGRLEKFPALDRAYLTQEYLHDNWQPRWFDQMAAELAPAKLTYLTTATAGDWFLAGMLPAPWKAFLAESSETVAQETMLDVLINQTFRRDVWARGATPLWPAQQRELLLGVRFALLGRPSPKEEGDNPYKYTTSLGEVSGKPEIYAPLYESLQSGPKTLGELIQVPVGSPADGVTVAAEGAPQRSLGDTLQALGLMLHAGHVALARGLPQDKPAKALNRALASAVLNGAPYRNLLAPNLPWVLSASDGDIMLAGLLMQHPKASAAQLAALWTQRLLALGRGLMKDGQSLTTREAMLPRAEELASTFLAKTAPQWQRLGVI